MSVVRKVGGWVLGTLVFIGLWVAAYAITEVGWLVIAGERIDSEIRFFVALVPFAIVAGGVGWFFRKRQEDRQYRQEKAEMEARQRGG